MKTIHTFTNERGFKSEFYFDGSVVRWVSNDRVPPADCLKEMFRQGLVIESEMTASKKARDAETAAFVAEYRANYKGPSAEELFEMRAAFGAGETVVNVITGRKIRL